MKKYIKYLGIGFLFLLLILVRAKSGNWFYDPFTEYFKNDYLYKGIPDFDLKKLLLNIFFRYSVNSVISMAIIYLAFKKKFLKFTFAFYFMAFIILVILLVIVLQFSDKADYKLLFYIRRFLIHPIFVLLLLPAFYHKDRMMQ